MPYRKTKQKQKTKYSFVELKKYLKIDKYVNINNDKLFVRIYFSKCSEVATLIG